jgi:hypothetical protein
VTIDGVVTAGDDPVAIDADKVWLYGVAIDEDTYAGLLALKERVGPDHPAHNPRSPIDPLTLSVSAVRASS